MFQRLPCDHADLVAEITLHRAVLDRGLMDSFHHDPEIRNDTAVWLDLNGQDFIAASERADLDPRLVFEIFVIVREMFKGQVNKIPEAFV